MTRIRIRIVEIWKRYRAIILSAIVVNIFVSPIWVFWGHLYKPYIEPADYSLSVNVCVPILIQHAEFIHQSTGQRVPVPPVFLPTSFSVMLKNNGSRYLDDNEFLIVFGKDTSNSEITDPAELKITDVVLASRSPLDQAGVSADFSGERLRVTAKRLNPGDFIYGEGIINRPASVEVFSRSIGLTLHEKRGASECSFFPQNLGNVYVFFSQNKTNEK